MHHTTYRGRSQTKKQNNHKPKLPLEERQKRSHRKKLERLFPNHISHLCQHYLALKAIPIENTTTGKEALRS